MAVELAAEGVVSFLSIDGIEAGEPFGFGQLLGFDVEARELEAIKKDGVGSIFAA